MSLAPGQRLGGYEVLSAIGVGGMGEVYRARDTKLLRDVAIKILPDSFAGDRDRLARFEREAQLLAALNHPNIAGIYGLEQAGDTNFLAMELVDGETLADRIGRGGPLAVGEAIAIAKQLADALQAAHDKGIIHRDLKPANIALTAEGQVKVLDFGLAKVAEGTSAEASATRSPTISVAMTEAGMILGTAAYMSPEQAKGRPVDKRSDVWAFGCVLFEMLAGKRAFEGEDASDTLAAVLRGEPDWKALPRHAPANIRTALAGCLEKDRSKRFADISVASYLLGEARPAPASDATLGGKAWMAVTAAVLFTAAIAGSAWLLARPDVVPADVMRFSIVPAADQTLLFSNNDRQVTISPDGRAVAYVGPRRQLFVRTMGSLDLQAVAISGEARFPFWSPDGRWIGFFAQTAGSAELKKVAVSGGPPITLTSLDSALRGATWSGETIVFATADPEHGLMEVSANGGAPTALTTPDAKAGERYHVFPSFLPGGRAILFTVVSGTDSHIAVLDREAGSIKPLIPGGRQPEFVEPDFLVYAVEGGALRAIRFDAERLETIGDSVHVLGSIVTSNNVTQFAVSQTGVLVHVPGAGLGGAAERTLVWVDRVGRETPLGAPRQAYQYPRVSPDGTRIAVSLDGANRDVWLLDPARGTLSRVTFDPGVDEQPAWHPDGRRIVYTSSRAGPLTLHVQSVDGTAAPVLLTPAEHADYDATVSADGQYLVFMEQHPGSGNDLMMMWLGGDQPRVQPLLQTSFSEIQPSLSPDGKWLAYASNESGESQVYVRRFPDMTDKVQVSTDGGSKPVWSPRGTELFYISPESAVMAASLEDATGPTFGRPARLFEWPLLRTLGNGVTYDVSRDGTRFLMVKPPSDETEDDTKALAMTVVVNWIEELKDALPAQ